LIAGAPATQAIVAITVVVFVLQHQLGHPTDLVTQLRMGALRGDLVWSQFDFYRLLCPIFLHGFLLHLVFNMFAFLQLGALVEYFYGSMRLVAFYLMTGLVASVISSVANSGVAASVGASGAIFGLAGVLVGMGLFAVEPLRDQIKGVGRMLFAQVAFWIVLGFAIGALWGGPFDNWAHLGGFMAGLVVPLFSRDPYKKQRWVEVLGGVLLTLSVASGVWAYADGDDAAQSADSDISELLMRRASETGDGWAGPAKMAALLAQLEEVGNAVGAEEVRDAYLADLSDPDQAQTLGAFLMTSPGCKRHARAAFERQLELDGEDPDALNNVAWAIVVADPERALQLADRAMDNADPEAEDHALFWLAVLDTKAEALYQLGRYEEALPLQEDAVARLDGYIEEMSWYDLNRGVLVEERKGMRQRRRKIKRKVVGLR